jgi:predicted DNA-binding protein (MmcQ/YjbR family)
MQPSLALRRLRAVMRRWPGVLETQSWGHPNWKRGRRQFASFDTYGRQACICFKTAPRTQAKLILRPNFRAAPYAASRGWVCRTLDEPLDWMELAGFLRGSHALGAAPARPKPQQKAERPTRSGRKRVTRG